MDKHQHNCKIESPAKLLALENSDDSDIGDHTDNRQGGYHGRLLDYIQATGEKGEIRVKFTSPLLKDTEVTLHAE